METTKTQPSRSIVTPPKREIPTWLKIVAGFIIAFFVIIILILVFIFGAVNKAVAPAQKIADTFVESIADGDYNGAYMLTSSVIQDAATVEDLQSFTEAYPVLDNAIETTWDYKSIEGNAVILSGTLYSADGTSPITMEIMEYGDEWLINLFSLNESDVPSDYDGSYEF